MEGSQEKCCKLCFTLVKDENFKIIELGKSLNCYYRIRLDGEDQIVCNNCSVKLFETYNFRAMCLETEDTISQYVHTSTIERYDLLEIYMMQKGYKDAQVVSDRHKVCRLCMQLIEHEAIPLREVDKEMIREFIPGMNLNVTIDPIICKKCHGSFITSSNFLTSCSNVASLRKLHGNDETVIDTHTIVPYIKTEEIDIKLEEEYERQGAPHETEFFNIKSEQLKHESDTTAEDEIKPYISEDQRSIISPTISSIQHTQVIDKRTPKTRRSHIFEYKAPQLKREAPATPQMFKCHECSYETISKNLLTKHELKHKCAAKVYMHKCSNCEYESERNKEEQTLKCRKCHHETKLTHVDVTHGQSTHADSAVETFKCEECQHKTSCRKEFISHLLTHKDLGEEPTYKCDQCDFETNIKQRFMLHEFKHKKTTGANVLKCEKCDFKSPHRQRFVLHQLTHRDAPEETYSCNVCTFETKVKKSLKRHLLRHKDRSELQMYKCDKCEFQTKRKDGLKTHQWRHRDPAEIPKFKCGDCDYVCHHKVNLTRHALRHRKPSDVVANKCD